MGEGRGGGAEKAGLSKVQPYCFRSSFFPSAIKKIRAGRFLGLENPQDYAREHFQIAFCYASGSKLANVFTEPSIFMQSR